MTKKLFKNIGKKSLAIFTALQIAGYGTLFASNINQKNPHKKANYTTYYSNKFSFSYPASWEMRRSADVTDSGCSEIEFISPKENQDDRVREYFAVVSCPSDEEEPTDKYMDSYMRMMIDITRLTRGENIETEIKKIAISDHPARKIEYPTAINGLGVISSKYIIFDKNSLYAFIFICEKNKTNIYKPLEEKIIQSIKLIEGQFI